MPEHVGQGGQWKGLIWAAERFLIFSFELKMEAESDA
jgi:hypothetical protein